MSLLVDESTHVDPAGQLGGDHRIPDESRAARPRSFDVDAFGLPAGREEEWRFTPVDRLGNVLSDAPTDGSDAADDLAGRRLHDLLRRAADAPAESRAEPLGVDAVRA